jgi:hypothetical protein
VSAYRPAIELTVRTIEQRSRRFRNLIIGVVTVALVAIAWCLIARSPQPLIGAVILVPLCGLFFAADHYALDAWRAELLTGWIARELDMAALVAAIRANPALPRETTEGMLATLPAFGDLLEEQQLPATARQAMAAELAVRHRALSDDMALRTAATGVVAGLLVTAVASRSWTPMWGLCALVAVPITRGWLQHRRHHLLTAATAPPAAH